MPSILSLKSKLLAVVFGLMIPFLALADEYKYPVFNMHRGVTPISHEVYNLHMIIFSICCVIGALVFGVMIIAMIKHRKSKGHVAAQFHEHSKLEIIWAIVPLVILVIMAIPATMVIRDMYNYENSDLTIKITGYQWKWQYEYLDYGIKFFSNLSTPLSQINNQSPKDQWYLLEVDNPVVVPIHKKIRFLLTASDVIHSWWVPALGFKRDAMPGFINEAWTQIETPGIYRGQCAELCGANHGYMPIVVIAKTEKEFMQWAEAQQKKQAQIINYKQKLTYAELMKLGQATYNKYCAACHQQTGLGLPPVYPALKGSSITVGTPIARHIDVILNGRTGTSMQAFKDQLTDLEIASVVTYERNAWDNNTADTVQALDIKSERERLASGKPTYDQKALNSSKPK
jgi:cytochrome c oxidase subunit II